MPAQRLRRSVSLLIAVFVLGVGGTPASASADSVTRQILGDCSLQPSLLGHYTVAQLRHALQVMTPEEKEYTSCPDVINRAILAALGGGHGKGGTGGGSGSFLPTPVIVIIVLLVLGGVTFAALAARRRRAPEDSKNTPLH